MKTFICLLTFTFLLGCSTSKANNENQAIQDSSKLNIEIERNRIQTQINALDSQIIHLDAMITSAQARRNIDPNLSAAIDSEILNYEAQKVSLKSQKTHYELMLKKF